MFISSFFRVFSKNCKNFCLAEAVSVFLRTIILTRHNSHQKVLRVSLNSSSSSQCCINFLNNFTDGLSSKSKHDDDVC